MQTEALHIICLDQPYPPIYGGAIDMYYKIKALHEAGVRLILHIFLYHHDESIPQIEQFASRTYYYKRKLGLRYFISSTPYIVRTRTDEQLIKDLLDDDYPILFEGLHSCLLLSDKRLKGRLKMVRTHNIEHQYYSCLAKYPNPIWKKIYYAVESLKLKLFESRLESSDRILAISEYDARYYKDRFPHTDVRLLNCFFDSSEEATTSNPYGHYVLYQGNIAVEENTKVVQYILQEIVPLTSEDVTFIIAGANPPSVIKDKAAELGNVKVIANPDNSQMSQLIANAQVNLVLTFQPTGIKLKLLTALCKGKGHCIVNKTMLNGNSLGRICIEADSATDIVKAITQNINTPLPPSEIKRRREYIHLLGYNNIDNITDL